MFINEKKMISNLKNCLQIKKNVYKLKKVVYKFPLYKYKISPWELSKNQRGYWEIIKTLFLLYV